jgi:hypothetical protein
MGAEMNNHEQNNGLAISTPDPRAVTGKNACAASQGVKLVPDTVFMADKAQESAPQVSSNPRPSIDGLPCATLPGAQLTGGGISTRPQSFSLQSGLFDALELIDRAKIRVLVGCEYSATVRDAFRARGFNAWSCDLLPCDGDPAWHIQGDLLEIMNDGWDLIIFHPPCTHLSVSGARHFAAKQADGRQQAALQFVRDLMACNARFWALENPVSIISTQIRKPDQTVQPWQFGHGETKRTCFWIKDLPLLVSTNVVSGREARVFRLPPSADRWKIRSKTFQGIADAMAIQWGDFIHFELSLQSGHGLSHKLASSFPSQMSSLPRGVSS